MTRPTIFALSLLCSFALSACDDDSMNDDTMAAPNDSADSEMNATEAAESGMSGDSEGMTESDEAGDETSAMQETAGHSERFEDVVTPSGMRSLLDTETDLLWVNDVQACNPLGAPTEDTPMIAMQYCDELMFAGFEDWRMPSVDEAAELITAAIDENVDLMYANPACPAVVAMGGMAVVTHNGDMPGTVTQMPPSVGIRCVRVNP